MTFAREQCDKSTHSVVALEMVKKTALLNFLMKYNYSCALPTRSDEQIDHDNPSVNIVP